MAKVISDKQEVVTVSRWAGYRVLAIAASMGIIWWVLRLIINEFILDAPLTSGSVAHVLMVLIGVAVLVRFRAARPPIVAIGTASVLWSIGGALDGLWWLEGLAWSVGLFTISYSLFSVIASINKMWLSVSTAIFVALSLVILLTQ